MQIQIKKRTIQSYWAGKWEGPKAEASRADPQNGPAAEFNTYRI